MATVAPELAVDPVQQVLHLSNSIALIGAMRAALESDAADQLLSGPKPIADIAAQAGLNEDALYRCLRALAAEQIFTEVEPRVFANTDASALIAAGHPLHLRESLLWVTSKFFFNTFTEFMYSVRTGKPCVEKVFGLPAFEYLPTNAETNREFNDAMTAMSAMVVPSVLATYDFSSMGTLCDVAGGHGLLLTSILQKHLDLRGILFDLDHVVEGAKVRINELGLASRCTTVSGNFFNSVPSADSYIMKHIIHDWDEASAIAILTRCARAMSGNGKILLVEGLVKGPNIPDFRSCSISSCSACQAERSAPGQSTQISSPGLGSGSTASYPTSRRSPLSKQCVLRKVRSLTQTGSLSRPARPARPTLNTSATTAAPQRTTDAPHRHHVRLTRKAPAHLT